MKDVEFLSWEELLALHEDQLQRYGGQQGFIDEGVVRSVMSRPQFTAQYNADADLADLAADYFFGFATTQGFMDGNKRTALSSASIFARKNGYRFTVSSQLMYIIAMAVAKSDVDRDALADILRDHLEELDEEG
jgi:death-on-curing protein